MADPVVLAPAELAEIAARQKLSAAIVRDRLRAEADPAAVVWWAQQTADVSRLLDSVAALMAARAEAEREVERRAQENAALQDRMLETGRVVVDVAKAMPFAEIERLTAALRAVEQREAALREALAIFLPPATVALLVAQPTSERETCPHCGKESRRGTIHPCPVRSALGGPTPDTEGTQ